MTASFSAEESAIIGMFLEALFYGIYLATFGYSIRVLLYQPGPRIVRKSKQEVKWWLLCVVSSSNSSTLVNISVALFWRYNLAAFALESGFKNPESALIDQNWMNVARYSGYLVLTTIGDMILIYRLYRLYERNYRVAILPFLLYLVAIGCCIVLITKGVAHSTLSPWAFATITYAMYSLNIAVNVFATSLITRKLWRARQRMAAFSSDPDRWLRVGRIMLDSGLIYTTGSILVLCTIPSVNLAYCVSDVVTPFIGIAFNLIIIRVNGVMQSSVQDVETMNWQTSLLVNTTHRLPALMNHANAIPITSFKLAVDRHNKSPTTT